jgi:hypothetical protein
MFGFKRKAKDVPGILEEGRSWTERLAAAADAADQQSVELNAEATAIVREAEVESQNIKNIASAFRKEADEGHAIAANFKTMLHVEK